MNEVDVRIFESFKKYLRDNGYKISYVTDSQIIGIEDDIRFSLDYDFDYNDYFMKILGGSSGKWTTIFSQNKDGTLNLNHSNDNRKFDSINEVIQFTLENSSK